MVLPVNVQMGAGQDATTLTVTNKSEDTTAFQVRAYASALSFGVYTGSALSASSGLSVACTSTTTYTIGLSAGTTTGPPTVIV